MVKSRSLLKWTFLLIQTSLDRVLVVSSSSTVSRNNLKIIQLSCVFRHSLMVHVRVNYSDVYFCMLNDF